ncbi:helix-turn-helix domain-containing protein [Sedimentibacter hydroxybenzoicus DSM 7310]|uniref:Helix-turn-helix domain-containing protein n=1 Tax=Sedimentibacter hydroxybenzoicus DSM 7310 TaxID=1123245 RepID=A0A974BM28_SEDHY|nr:sugar diacid recognition domain-containing protein [Sedimentibacter hydroxybenzoicus]NYB75080.1 helix-turn-helix domain-containing protein [Sedimentibacter hydroxybenzoicus DSM 7310]
MLSNNFYISEKYLQNILCEMKEIVDQDLIFMNTDGIIKASTVTSRIGNVHYGGKKVVETGRDLMIYSDQEYIGAKKGINMPVRLDETIIGVIGITGNSDEVIKYVKIIKRLTEIFIKDGYAKDIENSEIKKDRMILESLLFSETNIDQNYIARYENLFGIKNKIPRFVIISTIIGNESKIVRNIDDVFRIFRATLKGSKTIISLTGNNIVMILESDSTGYCNELIIKVKNEIKNKINLNMRFGIGDKQTEISRLRISYLKAMDALKWSSIVTKENVTYYEDFDIEIILSKMPSTVMDEYVEKLFSKLGASEIKDMGKIIELYENHNGSLKLISQELFIHKNTLQYKINKLHEKTGYDMRNLRHFMALRIAFILKKYVS